MCRTRSSNSPRDLVPATMEAFYRAMGLPTILREVGIAPTDEQCDAMAASCARAAGGKKGNAKVLTQPDMAAIYKAAR